MADSATNEIQNILVRLKTLATQASSANNSTQLAALETERVSLENQLTNLATGANYNGVKLLDGTGGTLTFQVGATNTAADQITADMTGNLTATGLGLAGATATFTTQAGAQAYIATLDAALTTVTTTRAKFGAVQNNLGYVSANLATSIEQTNASIGAIRDADLASAMAEKTKLTVLNQAGMAMLAQANQTAQSILTLFR